MADSKPLRSGWTTGTCAAAAARAAARGLVAGRFPTLVTVALPKGEQPGFQPVECILGEGFAAAGVVKDAGDDPDVTHGALIIAVVRRGSPGTGVVFRAGPGVGTVTRPGLPVAVGEPAINPVPRRLIAEAVEAEGVPDAVVEISVPGGEELALRTWNPRLGIQGGISILGTTGVVVPYSCSAWIHAIRQGVDVARASGLGHVAACTGRTSETATRMLLGLPDEAMLDMGDFVGGLLKYVRDHPVRRLTLGGGFAKMAKLAAGNLDLHSRRSRVDFEGLADLMADLGAEPAMAERVRAANTADQVLTWAERAGLPLADAVAEEAGAVAMRVLAGAEVALDVLVFDRSGRLAGRTVGVMIDGLAGAKP